MNEQCLKSSFEFGTQLMNNIDALTKNEYRCIKCSYEMVNESVYKFNYVFKSSFVKKEIIFSYTINDNIDKCKFHVLIESENSEKIELNKLIDVDNFNCENYDGEITDKIQSFVEKLNILLSKQFLSYIS